MRVDHGKWLGHGSIRILPLGGLIGIPDSYRFSSLLQSIFRRNVRTENDINIIDNAIRLPILINRLVLRLMTVSIPVATSRQKPIEGMYKTLSFDTSAVFIVVMSRIIVIVMCGGGRRKCRSVRLTLLRAWTSLTSWQSSKDTYRRRRTLRRRTGWTLGSTEELGAQETSRDSRLLASPFFDCNHLNLMMWTIHSKMKNGMDVQ